MRRAWSLAIAIVLILAFPNAAFAAVDKHVVEFDDTFEDPAAAVLCGVEEVWVRSFGTQRITEFFDKAGDLTAVKISFTGTTEVSDGEGNLLAWEQFGGMAMFDLVEGTLTENGNTFNYHVQGEGIVVNDSGRSVTSLEDGSLLEVNGPHQSYDVFPPVLICAAIAG